jgi:hypothetical protein
MVRPAGLYILHVPASTSELRRAFAKSARPFVGCFEVWDGPFIVLIGGPTNIGWMTGSDVVVDGGGRAMEYELCVRLMFADYTLL